MTKQSIKILLTDNKIAVPSYQRAYSWTTKGQVDVFLSDLENYVNSGTESKYYIGHFIFQRISESQEYDVIDGQQRLTTIVIFLSAIRYVLNTRNELTQELEGDINNMINGRFSTVQYDNDFFENYIIKRKNTNVADLTTESQKCIKKAFEYFVSELMKMPKERIDELLMAITKASYTDCIIDDEAEAVQMFIFQNNRGKEPTKLEIIKALFMYNVLLFGGNKAKNINKKINQRFQDIYQYNAVIESYLTEDEILNYTLQVYKNDLQVWGIIERVEKEMTKDSRIEFIDTFTNTLCESFKNIKLFYEQDRKKYYDIHSIISLNSYNNIIIPFVIKAYQFSLSKDEICRLCRLLEAFLIHQLVIGHRADISRRLKDVFKEFNEINTDIKPIEDLFKRLFSGTDNGWWNYWTDKEFKNAINWASHNTLKFILWKYENYLLKRQSGNGYEFVFKPYNSIEKKQVEHIAPQTPTNGEPVAAGYCEYDEEFKLNFLNNIGNYLLISQKHNVVIGNKSFARKRETYSHLEQQKEVVDMTRDSEIWDKAKIQEREGKLMEFIKEIYCIVL